MACAAVILRWVTLAIIVYFSHSVHSQNWNFFSTRTVEWNPCISGKRSPKVGQKLSNCTSVFALIESVCERLKHSDGILQVTTDRDTAGLLASLLDLISDWNSNNDKYILNVLSNKTLRFHRNQVAHGAIQGVFDLLRFWRRMSLAIIIDEMLDVPKENFEQLISEIMAKGEVFSLQDIINEPSKIVKIADKWIHLVVITETRALEALLQMIADYKLFANDRNTWLFVSTNQSLEHLLNITTPTAQINIFIDDNNTLTSQQKKFLNSLMTVQPKNWVWALPHNCWTLVHNYKDDQKSYVTFKLTDQFSLRMATSSGMQLYDLFHSQSTNQTEVLKVAYWTATRGLEFYYDVTKMDPSGNLKGRLIKITTLEDPPYLFIPIKKNVSSIGGYLKDIMFSITEKLNFRPEVRISPSNVFGSEIATGNYSGLVGILYRREADVAMSVFGMTVKRTEAIRYTAPVIKGDMSIFIRRPSQGASYTAYFNTFNSNVWMCVGVTLIVCLLSVLAVNYYKPQYIQSLVKINTIKDRMYWVLSGLFYEELFLRTPGAGPKLVMGVFLISVLLVFAHYTSTLTSFLIYQQINLPFQTIDDLVYQHPEYTIVLVSGTNHYDRFRTSRAGVFRDVWKRVSAVDDPNDVVSDLYDGLDLAYTGRYAFFSDGPSTKFLSAENCSITYLKERYFKEFYFFPARNDFPYNKIFSVTLRKLSEIGLIKFLKMKYLPFLELEKCPLKQISTSLGLIQVVTLFFILVCGILCCFIILTIEIFTQMLIQRMERNVNNNNFRKRF